MKIADDPLLAVTCWKNGPLHGTRGRLLKFTETPELGSKAEARGMVRLVHSILKAGLGRAYNRLPEKSRRIHFGQIDRLMAEHLSIHTTDTEA